MLTNGRAFSVQAYPIIKTALSPTTTHFKYSSSKFRVEIVRFTKPTSARSLLGLFVVVFEAFGSKRLFLALGQQHREIPGKIAW